MINYFIPELSADQAEKLRAGSISFYEFTLGEERGVMIEEGGLQATLAILQAGIAKQDQTTYDGIVRLKIENFLAVAEPGDGILSGTWKGKGKDAFAHIAAQILKPRLRKPIKLHNPQQVAKAVQDGSFHVHVFSSPQSCKVGVTVPSRCWGIPSASQKNAWPASGLGRAIKNETGTYAIAELVGDNNLYIHQDLAAVASAEDLALFAQVLNRAVYMLEPLQERDALRALFVEECRKGVTHAMLVQDNATADGEEESPRSVAKELARQIRATRADELRLLTHESLSLERFGEEYDNLRKVPKVIDVRVEDGEIRVFTETLYARDGQFNWHEIGAFQISLNPKERSPRWKNQTRLVNGYKAHMHAPHVWDTGAACLGNTVTTFDTLFTGQLWSIAAALAIEFVENVNLADPAGKHIVSWPLGTPPAAVPGEREIVKDEKYLGHRRKYMIACAKRMDEVVAAARNQLIAQRTEIERLEAKLVALLRNKAIAARRKKGLGVCDSAEFAREFDALQKMPQIAAIHVEPRVLKLVTETLYANHPGSGERHEIGRFKITIHMDGRGDSIRWVNLNATTHGCVKNQQAPQVLQSGRAFMSEIKESFAELIAAAQFSTVAQLAIDFIQQVDVDQPSGVHISKWPKASS